MNYRIRNLHKKIKLSKISGFLVIDKPNLQYLLGNYIEGEYWLLVTTNRIYLISSKMLYHQLKHFFSEFEIIQSEKFIDGLASLVRNKKLRSIGIDPLVISVDLYQKLKTKLKGVSVKQLKHFLSLLRQIKTQEELNLIRTSCRVAAKVMKLTTNSIIKQGLTEEYVSNKIKELFYQHNVEPAFEPIVATGSNSSYPHHVSSTKRIQADDIVLIDLGCRYKGYCSDLTRTIFLGNINSKIIKLYNAVKLAYKKAIEALKDGVKTNSINSIATITAKKYSQEVPNAEYLHNTGHGIGIEVHELPRISKDDNTVIKSGMVCTIEPGLYVSGSFGVRYENTLLVTNSGCEVLTD